MGAAVLGLAFSPDGSILATAGNENGQVRLWRVTTHHQIGHYLSAGGTDAYGVAFTPSGRTLVTTDTDGTIRLWNLSTRREIGAPIAPKSHPEFILGVLSPDGKILATVGSTLDHVGTVLRSLARPDMLSALIERDWQVPAERVVLYRSLANDVYRVDPGHFLKVYRHGWRTPGEVAWECDLIMHLARAGIAVAPVTCRADGSAVGVWQAPEGPRALLLFQAVPGHQPERPFLPAVHRAHGELIARVHDAGEAFSSPHPRRTQDPAALLDQSLAEVGPQLPPADRAVAGRIAAAARAGLLSSPPTRGLCHGDATMDNVLMTGGSDENPELTLIDFDLSGPGVLAMDFPYGIPNWDHFLAGYTSVRPVSLADLTAGPWIGAIALIANLQFHLITKPSWRGEESKAEGWLDQILDDLRTLDHELG